MDRPTAPNSIALVVSYLYDTMNRMTEIDESGFGAVARFSYDPGGRRVTQNRTLGTSTSYSYDAADQLKTLTNVLASTKNADPSNDLGLSFQRNLAGQIVNKAWTNDAYQWTALPAGTTSLNYDHLNRPISIAHDTCGPTSGYDCNGNLVSDATRSALVYDEENHLVSGALGATTVALSYDPAGRLQQTAATTGGSTTTTQFLYSGANMVAEYDGSGTLLNRYLPGPGTDEWLMQYAYDQRTSQIGQRRHMLYTDNQGSVVASSATNGNGAPTLYAYGPNGEPSTWAGSRFRYTGQTAIPELQLYYYKARFYDPASGRFLQTDPIGTKDDLDLYAYVGNDPIDEADPSGQCMGNPGETCPYDFEGQWHRLTSAIGKYIAAHPGKSLIIAGTTAQFIPTPQTRVGGRVATVAGEAVEKVSGEDERVGDDGSGVGPGPYAHESTPAGPRPRPNAEQQREINRIGNKYGCHSCGARDPGTRSGNYIGDHPPPNKLNPPGGEQSYYPHCQRCSNIQGGRLRQMPRPARPPPPSAP